LASVALAIVTMTLIVVAVIVAARPFGVTVDLADRVGPHAKPLLVSGTCDAAATTAWNDDSKDELALWAVTVGTNMMGYTPILGSNVKYVLLDGHEARFPGPYCVGEARHRLIVAGVMVAFGVLLVGAVLVVHRRRIA